MKQIFPLLTLRNFPNFEKTWHSISETTNPTLLHFLLVIIAVIPKVLCFISTDFSTKLVWKSFTNIFSRNNHEFPFHLTESKFINLVVFCHKSHFKTSHKVCFLIRSHRYINVKLCSCFVHIQRFQFAVIFSSWGEITKNIQCLNSEFSNVARTLDMKKMTKMERECR